MKQYLHLLAYSGVGMLSDYWMPSTTNVVPEESDQISLGLYFNILNNKYNLSLESYYKLMNNLIAFKTGESFFGSPENWENKIIVNGKGYTKGIEFLIQKSEGKTTGLISLTISKSEREFQELNNGKKFPFKYDRRVDAGFIISQDLNEKIFISLTWKFGTGYPVTLPFLKYNSFDKEIVVFEDLNSERMQNYHRLDVGINFINRYRWGEGTLNISIFNVYNRKNPYYYYFKRETYTQIINGNISLKEGNMKIYRQSLFPFFPTISYSLSF